MRALTLAIAGLCAVVPVATAMATSGREVINEFLEKGTELFAKQGFAPTDWQYRGQLDQNKEERVTIKLIGGRSYELLGACDKDCQDLDIHVLAADSKMIAQDEAQDNTPVVAVPASGTYIVRVVMVKCKSQPCHYAIQAFARS